jgi:hypothetical protein
MFLQFICRFLKRGETQEKVRKTKNPACALDADGRWACKPGSVPAKPAAVIYLCHPRERAGQAAFPHAVLLRIGFTASVRYRAAG